MQNCIDNCNKCAKICLETLTYCLKQGGKHAEEKHIQSLLSCIEACKLSENYMLRQSNLHMEACKLCAKACQECLATCKAIDAKDEQMNKCIEQCNICMETCKKMAC